MKPKTKKNLRNKMRRRLSDQKVSTQIIVITISWITLSLLDVATNMIWHDNPNWSWMTSLGAGAIYGILIMSVHSLFKEFFESRNKLKYLCGFILYVLFWLLINWHRLFR